MARSDGIERGVVSDPGRERLSIMSDDEHRPDVAPEAPAPARGRRSRRGGARRRRRTVRLGVSTTLMATATLLTVTAVSLASTTLLAVAAVATVLCGWAAVRIVRHELAASRITHAAERADQARAYRDLTAERVAEQAAFVRHLGGELAEAYVTIGILEGTVNLLEKRVDETERSSHRQRQRAESAEARVAELAESLAVRQAEEADELATWTGGDLRGIDESDGNDDDTIVDLLAWDERSRGDLGIPQQRKQA